MLGKNKRSDFVIKKGMLVKYRGKGGNVTIPKEVTAIGLSAFHNCEGLRSVTFHGGLTSIGAAAFDNCKNLTKVVFADGLKKIGARAFAGCGELVRAELPAGLESIGDSAFYECTALSFVTAPDSIERIGNLAFGDTAYQRDPKNAKNGVIYLGKHVLKVDRTFAGLVDISDAGCVAASAFHGCQYVSEVILPRGLTVLDNDLFHGCRGLKSVVLPDSLCEIGTDAFSDCRALDGIVIPDGVKKIGDRAFKDCGITECVLPDKLKTVPDECFGGCGKLARVVFPKKLKLIRSAAFRGCESLAELRLPDSLETLQTGAFSDCRALCSVHIPEKLRDFHGMTFTKCSALKEFTVSEKNEKFYTEDGILYERGVDGDKLCKYPEGKIAEVYRMPDTVNHVLYEALGHCKGLNHVVFSPNIKKIVLSNIADSESICTVTVPEGPVETSVSSFGCKNFTDIYLPERLDRLVIYEWSIEALRVHISHGQARERLALGEEKSFISAVKAYVYDRVNGRTGAEDNAEWRQLIAENLRLCQKNLADDPDFYTFLTEEKLVSRRVATTMLEKSGSIECRAILLAYLKTAK